MEQKLNDLITATVGSQEIAKEALALAKERGQLIGYLMQGLQNVTDDIQIFGTVQPSTLEHIKNLLKIE